MSRVEQTGTLGPGCAWCGSDKLELWPSHDERIAKRGLDHPATGCPECGRLTDL